MKLTNSLVVLSLIILWPSKRMYNFYYENLPLKSGVGGDIIVNDTLDTSIGGIAVMLK